MSPNNTTPNRKRKHGHKAENLNINQDHLLQEAHSWQPNQSINWTALGRQYGLNNPNSGQVLKEYLAEEGIPAACIHQWPHRSQRRRKKRLPGGKVSFPMHPPVKKLKQCVQERIDTGEIRLGESIVTTTDPRHIARDGKIIEESVEVSARKVPLYEIRRRLLEKHENLGVIQQHSDEYYNTLSTEEIKKILIELHERVELNLTIEELQCT